MGSPPVIKSRRKEPHLSASCPYCKIELEYKAPDEANFTIECAACKETFAEPQERKKSKPGGRRLGTDAKPLETEYYDALGVKPDASLQDIKSAYRRLAIKLHPDKNPNDPEAEEKFKLLAIAYNTLSDPVTRKRYNEFGGKKDAESEVVDPEAVFSTLFGGDRFTDIIGTISLGAEMKTALQQQNEDDEEGTSTAATTTGKKADLTPEEKAAKAKEEAAASAERAKVREERVAKLAETLSRKLALFSEQATSEMDAEMRRAVRQIWQIEAGELKDESYGVELLQTVGATYTAKARHWLSSTSTPFGMGGWIHSARSSAHTLGETWATLRAAYDVKAVFDELAAAEKEGSNVSEERKKELEEQAAAKGLKALFKGSKLEVESVIREVCDRVLSEPGLSREGVRKRAVALDILGQVYSAVQKDPNAPDPLNLESGYVKVDSKRPTSPPKYSSSSASQPSPSPKFDPDAKVPPYEPRKPRPPPQP